MKLGIMQPYFFPYLGYFGLIKHTDYWVFLDTVQFIRHGWIERNRILNSDGSWQYIKVPLVKHHRNNLIKDIQIRNSENWKEKIFAQLKVYKKKAPFYNEVIRFLEDAFQKEFDDITHLNAHLTAKVCTYLGIEFNYEIFSDSNIEIEEVQAPDEWALNISKALQADSYINPPGAKELFDREKYHQAGIEIQFLKTELREYAQGNQEFIPGLSIIDVMMFNSPVAINDMLDTYSLES